MNETAITEEHGKRLVARERAIDQTNVINQIETERLLSPSMRRLQALAQAVSAYGAWRSDSPDADAIIAIARTFDAFLAEEETSA